MPTPPDSNSSDSSSSSSDSSDSSSSDSSDSSSDSSDSSSSESSDSSSSDSSDSSSSEESSDSSSSEESSDSSSSEESSDSSSFGESSNSSSSGESSSSSSSEESSDSSSSEESSDSSSSEQSSDSSSSEESSDSSSTDSSSSDSFTQAPLEITTDYLPDGTVNAQYLDQSGGSVSVKADGGVGSYTFSCDESTLPPGLSFSSDGVLSGTPTDEGNFWINVTVEDSAAEDLDAEENNKDTADIECNVKAFKITGPEKIGVVTEFSKATAQVYTVTVPDGIDPTKVNLQQLVIDREKGRVKVTRKEQIGNTIPFEVKGTQQSKDENDVLLRLFFNGQPLPQPIKQLSVVVPFLFANLESSTQVVVPETRAFTRYSSPSYDFSAQPGNWCLQGTFWGRVLSITVHDQFDHELGNLYDKAEIAEEFFDAEGSVSGTILLNQQLHNGTYSDPTGLSPGLVPILQQTPVPTDRLWILGHTPPTSLLHGAELEEAGTITIPEQTKTAQVTVGKLPMRDKITRKQKVDPANQLTITHQ